MSSKNATERIAPDAAGIARAADVLRRDGVVAVPTETVYGLAARADRERAVAKVFQAKGRPQFNPLIVHVGDVEQARRLARFDRRASALAEHFWPGPLTLVLPGRDDSGLSGLVSAGLPTLALRVPAHPVMRAILGQCDFPLAAPSANRSETVSPTRPDHVLATLDGRIDAVIDAGACERGLESSIVALREGGGWDMLRPGPVGPDEIGAVLGEEPGLSHKRDGAHIEAPGQLARHYAPGKPMRLNAVTRADDEFFIGFGDVQGDTSLSSGGDLAEAAARLYECLHRARLSPQPRIAVAPVPEEGVGLAINDRLRRAAA